MPPGELAGAFSYLEERLRDDDRLGAAGGRTG
jgi:hypothetical protein